MSKKTELEIIKERWQDIIRQNPGDYSAARYRVGGTQIWGFHSIPLSWEIPRNGDGPDKLGYV